METAPALVDAKRCPGCGEHKSLTAFHNRRAAKDGKQTRCKRCQATRQRDNREQCAANTRAYRKRGGAELRRKERFRVIWDKYRLTMQQFDDLLASQRGVCASCGGTELGNDNWHIDHDHDCCPGKYTCGQCIRGILCPRCNKAIGMFNDDPDLMHAAAAYIIRSKSQPVAPGILSRPASGQ